MLGLCQCRGGQPKGNEMFSIHPKTLQGPLPGGGDVSNQETCSQIALLNEPTVSCYSWIQGISISISKTLSDEESVA